MTYFNWPQRARVLPRNPSFTTLFRTEKQLTSSTSTVPSSYLLLEQSILTPDQPITLPMDVLKRMRAAVIMSAINMDAMGVPLLTGAIIYGISVSDRPQKVYLTVQRVGKRSLEREQGQAS
jgi:hypothetical protein